MSEQRNNGAFWPKFRVYASILTLSIAMLVEGAYTVWTTPMMKKLEGNDDNPLPAPLTTSQSSILAAIPAVGSVIGALTFGFLARHFGRKTLIQICTLPSFTGTLILAFSTQLWLFYTARTIQGFSFGGISTVLPMYIAEVADPKIRGRLATALSICNNLGILFAFAAGPHLSFLQFHILMAAISAIYFLSFSVFAYESPYYLIQKDRVIAEEVLRNLRLNSDDVSFELAEMELSIQRRKDVKLLDIFKIKSGRRALFNGIILTTLSLMSGAFALVTFVGKVFDEAGGDFSEEQETVFVASVQVVVVFLSSTYNDKVGRKLLLSLSFSGICVSHAVLGTYFIMKSENSADSVNLGWIPIVSYTCYIISFESGMGALKNVVIGEIFPLGVKSIGLAIILIVSSLVGFVQSLTFQGFEKVAGFGTVFYTFAFSALVNAIFIQVFMVETRGRTLEEIQDEMSEDVFKTNISKCLKIRS